MKKLNITLFVVPILLTVIGISFSHLSLNPIDQMNGMDTHYNAATCQNVCTYGTVANKVQNLLPNQDVNKKPELFYITLVAIDILLLSILRYQKLYLSSSWRPPDIVLLSGKYGVSL